MQGTFPQVVSYILALHTYIDKGAVIDTPLPLCHRVCRLVCTSNKTATHSYIAPASITFTAHSGATLIKAILIGGQQPPHLARRGLADCL